MFDNPGKKLGSQGLNATTAATDALGVEDRDLSLRN